MTNEEPNPAESAVPPNLHDTSSNHNEDTGEEMRAEDHGSAPESARETMNGEGNATWKTALGLLVVWGALMGVFTANGISDARIEPARPRGHAQNAVDRPAYRMASHQWLTDPFMVRFPTTSTADALKMLGTYCDLRIDEDSLAVLGPGHRESRDFRFDEIPLYQLLHQVIGDDKIGLVLDRDRLRLIPQKLSLERHEEVIWRLQWDAELELTGQKIVVSPTGEMDLWVVLMLEDPMPASPNSWRTLVVELWQGGRWVAMGRTSLIDNRAELSLQTTERMRLGIQRSRAATATTPALFGISLNWTYPNTMNREP